jgi:hypothetical protein
MFTGKHIPGDKICGTKASFFNDIIFGKDTGAM